MKIKDYNDAIEFFKTNDFRAADGAWSEFYQSEVLEPRITDLADGGRIGFKDGLSVDVYNTVYDEYVDLVETGLKNNKLIDTPTWESFVKSKGYKSPSLMYYADKPAPTTLLREKKLELAKKLIDAENLKLDGKWKMHKDGASSIFQGKIFNNRLTQNPGTIEGDVGRLVNKYLDSKDDKIKRAFNYIMNPEYKMAASGETGVAHEIQRLIAPDTVKGRITKDIRKTLEAIPEYKEIEDKLKYINRIITKVPKGTDMSMGYLMEMAENNKLGRANFEDWWKLAGDKPEQFAMREVVRNWNNSQGKGDFKLYDLNGKELKWKGKDTKLNTNKILFSYADPENLGYKNKLYSFFKPDAKTLATINKAVPNEGVFDLKGNIRKLGEFNELVEVVDGRNKLFNTEMIDPFTGEKSTYKKVYENIYKRINTTAYGTKEGYSKIKSMAGQIDHDFGSAKYPFNNLRLSTGQQNLMFKTLADAAATNPDLEPYVRALESEMYTGGSIDDQIKAIVNETNELGKVVKNAPGKITIPTATETAAYKFLKNEIPGVPESVIKYLEPKAAIAESTIKVNPQILNAFCSSTRKPLATAGVVDGLVCSMDEIQENIKKQTNQAMKATKDGKVPKKFGKLRALGKFFGWVDAPIEFMFAAPHLIAGDVEGAKRATTAGLAGWGKVDLDKISDKEAQRYIKHTQAMNDYFDNYNSALNADNQLKNMEPGSENYFTLSSQFERAKTNMDKIQEDYQSYGYTYQDGDIPMKDKVATQNYIRDKVKSDFENKIENIASNETFKDADPDLLKEQLKDLGGRPEKVTPITDLESYMRNKGEEMAGNTNLFFNQKPYVLEEAEALGVGDIFDDYALGAGVEAEGRKSLQDAYSEIPLKYANELAALEKKQLEEGLKKKRIQQILKNQYFSQGGIASLKK